MDVSENHGTPKSSILLGFSIINHPFWDTTIFGNTHIYLIRMFLLKVAIFSHDGTWRMGFSDLDLIPCKLSGQR